MTKHDIKLTFDLEFLTVPNVPLDVKISLNNEIISHEFFTPSRVKFNVEKSLTAGINHLTIDFYNKPYDYCTKDRDIAVIVHSVNFQNLPEEFKHYSIYRPCYPEPWLSEQKALGIRIDNEIIGNYLGWSGTWILRFETPIYQWIHRTLNLGWLI